MRKMNHQIENTNKETDIILTNWIGMKESSVRTCVGSAKLKHGAALYFKTILLASYRNPNHNNLGTKGNNGSHN